MNVSVDGPMDLTGSTSSNVEIGNQLFTTFSRIAQRACSGHIKWNVHVGITTRKRLDQSSPYLPLIKYPETEMSRPGSKPASPPAGGEYSSKNLASQTF
jgi:hypothetical protein